MAWYTFKKRKNKPKAVSRCAFSLCLLGTVDDADEYRSAGGKDNIIESRAGQHPVTKQARSEYDPPPPKAEIEARSSNEWDKASLDTGVLEPCSPLYVEGSPPLYVAYTLQTEIQHPDFSQDAVGFALCDSQPPQPSAAEELNRPKREEAEQEQGQFLRSIQYGDQLNRGLDELKRFQEDLMTEIKEISGLTAEHIARQRKLSSWDNDDDVLHSDIEDKCD